MCLHYSQNSNSGSSNVLVYSLFFQRAIVSMILKHFSDFEHSRDPIQFSCRTGYCYRRVGAHSVPGPENRHAPVVD